MIAWRRRLRPKVLTMWRRLRNAKVSIGLRRGLAGQHRKLAPLDLRHGFAA